jgi:hypothetical protein
MLIANPVAEHQVTTRTLAENLKPADIYHWLVEFGYFPESYVLPPCFRVAKRPAKQKRFVPVEKKGKQFKVPTKEVVKVQFPKSELTDRVFGIIHPEIHNDIAYHISRNWKTILGAMLPKDSIVATYSFPIPIDSRYPGRLGHLRSGRMIYEFLGMVDDDLASIAYRYKYLVKADIKNFYPSIYTHSIAWAIHGKKFIRKPVNLHNFSHVGNRLDRLFQRANDNCTNGVPIGPVVSDIVAEIVASAVDRAFTKLVQASGLECEAVRFKDDYRILVNTETDGQRVIKFLQRALKDYNLEISETKTSMSRLPDGLFREWVSQYHVAYPRKRKKFTWKQFRELYLAVLQIDRQCPGTGVIDRFLADIVTKDGRLKLTIGPFNLQKVISMLLILASRRVKSFPKVLAIIEGILRSPFGIIHEAEIVAYLENYLRSLSDEEDRNKHLISWVSYFLVSNKLKDKLAFKPTFKDPVTRTVYNNHGHLFKDASDFKLFEGSVAVGKKVSMIEHLDVFDPPGFA